MKPFPSISFIIPTRNASFFLSLCLQSIRSQDYPSEKIEILVVDGGSTDNTKEIAKKFGAIIISNKQVFQEPGKALGTKSASGELVFYIDADNILSTNLWLREMVLPYRRELNVTGLLPQTIPDPNAHPIDRYFGYLFTDPFTWFIYQNASNPMLYEHSYKPLKKTKEYILYSFPSQNLPLFGFAQGVGSIKSLGHGSGGYADDMLSGIHAIEKGQIVAYIPNAGVYHYHILNLQEYIRKYSWRVKNNLKQRYENVGLTLRLPYFSILRKFRMYLFIPYAFSIIFPFIDSIRLVLRHKNAILLLHTPLTFLMALIICKEYLFHFLHIKEKLGFYE